MSVIGAYEAKTHLPSLLARVENGETFTISKHGRPIALLLPAAEPSRVEDALEGMLAMRELLRSQGRSGLRVPDLIEEGRR